MICPPSIAIAYVDCTTMGQGILDFCYTVNLGSPGDVLVVVDRAGVACGNMASGGGRHIVRRWGNDRKLKTSSEAITTTKGGTSTEGS